MCPHALALTDVLWKTGETGIVTKSRVIRKDKDGAIIMAYACCLINVFIAVPQKGATVLQSAYAGPVVYHRWLSHNIALLFWPEHHPLSGDFIAIFACIGFVIISTTWFLDGLHGARNAIMSIAGACMIWVSHCFFRRLLFLACVRLAFAMSIARNESLDMLNNAIKNLHKYNLKTFQHLFRKSKLDETHRVLGHIIGAVVVSLCMSSVFYVGKDIFLERAISWGHHCWNAIPVVYMFVAVLYPTIEADYEQSLAILEARAFLSPTHEVWSKERIDKLEKVLVPTATPAMSICMWLLISIVFPLTSTYMLPSLNYIFGIFSRLSSS